MSHNTKASLTQSAPRKTITARVHIVAERCLRREDGTWDIEVRGAELSEPTLCMLRELFPTQLDKVLNLLPVEALIDAIIVD